MSNKNHIDELVNRALADDQIAFDEAHWDGVQSFLAYKKKKKRRAIIYWTVGILVLCSASYVTLNQYWNGPDENQMVNTEENTDGLPNNESLNGDSLTPSELAENEKNGQGIGDSLDLPNDDHYKSLANSEQWPKGATATAAEGHDSAAPGVNGQNTASKENEPGTHPTKKYPVIDQSTKPRKEVVFNIGVLPGQKTKNEGSRSEEGSMAHEGTPSTDDPPASENTVREATNPDQPSNNTAGGDGRKAVDFNVKVGEKNDDLLDSIAKPPLDSIQKVKGVDSKRIRTKGLDLDTMASMAPTGLQDSVPGRPDSSSTDATQVEENPTPEDSITAPIDSTRVLAMQEDDPSEKSNKLKGFFMTPYLGPSISRSILDGGKPELLEKRNAEEDQPWSIDLGLTGRYYFENQLYIGTGIGYFEMGENANYSGFSRVQETTISDNYYTYRDTGYIQYTSWDSINYPFPQRVYTSYKWVEEVVDSTLVLRQKTVYDTLRVEGREVRNRFSYLEIPIVVGYHIPVGKWSFGLDAGSGFNFLMGVKGQYPDMENIRYNPLEKSDYRFISNSFISNFSVGRRLGEHWIVNGNMRFRRQLNTAERNNDGLRSRYQSIGFQFKVNYQW